jgi:hypothetical protein
MELQMKAICDGQRTKNDVVQQSLEQYRTVYVRTKNGMGVLKAVSFMHLYPKVVMMEADWISRLFRNTFSTNQRSIKTLEMEFSWPTVLSKIGLHLHRGCP